MAPRPRQGHPAWPKEVWGDRRGQGHPACPSGVQGGTEAHLHLAALLQRTRQVEMGSPSSQGEVTAYMSPADVVAFVTWASLELQTSVTTHLRRWRGLSGGLECAEGEEARMPGRSQGSTACHGHCQERCLVPQRPLSHPPQCSRGVTSPAKLPNRSMAPRSPTTVAWLSLAAYKLPHRGLNITQGSREGDGAPGASQPPAPSPTAR